VGPTTSDKIKSFCTLRVYFNPLKAELHPICNLLALLGSHHILRVSRIRVKITLRQSGRKKSKTFHIKKILGRCQKLEYYLLYRSHIHVHVNPAGLFLQKSICCTTKCVRHFKPHRQLWVESRVVTVNLSRTLIFKF
jgi:hypothetical protein